MALSGSGSTWATSVVNALKTLNPEITGQAETDLLAQWEKVWTASATHVVSNTAVIVTSVSGVTPGGGASGPGTGTVT